MPQSEVRSNDSSGFQRPTLGSIPIGFESLCRLTPNQAGSVAWDGDFRLSAILCIFLLHLPAQREPRPRRSGPII
jgi:hypothetical protein